LLEDGLVNEDFLAGMSTGGKMDVGAGGGGMGAGSGGGAGGNSEYAMESPEAGSLLASGANGKRNGKWIDVADWTPCSMPCGGGSQFKERFCIPPANGGRGCMGPTKMERICNSQPCPGASGGAGGGAGGMGPTGGKVPVHNLPSKTLPMSIQMKQISTRPQR